MFQRRCLFQFIILFYIISILPQVTLSPVHCPVGQIGHRLDMGQTRCCKQWRYTCPPGYPYTICDKHGGWDHCEKCQIGFIQPNPSNSSNRRRVCFRKPRGSCISEDQIPLNAPAQGRPTCVCDRSQDYVEVSLGCDLRTTPCGIGKERQLNGSCSTCVIGTFKNWEGPGLCIPITNCEMNGQEIINESTPEKDNMCGGGNTTTTHSPTTTAHHETSPLTEPQPEPTEDYSPYLKWLYSLLLLPVIAGVAWCVWKKRRQITCNSCRLCHVKCTDICTRCLHGQRDQRTNDIPMDTVRPSEQTEFSEEHIYEPLLPEQQHIVQSLPTPDNQLISQGQQLIENTTESQSSSAGSVLVSADMTEDQLKSRRRTEGQSLVNGGDVKPARVNSLPNQRDVPVAAVKPMMTAEPVQPNHVLGAGDEPEYSRMVQGEEDAPPARTREMTAGLAQPNLVLRAGDDSEYLHVAELEEDVPPDNLGLGPILGIGDGPDGTGQELPPNIHNLTRMEI